MAAQLTSTSELPARLLFSCSQRATNSLPTPFSPVIKTLASVGADKDINVDVRVIAATNKDLMKEVEARNFRLDLYHRLSVIVIHVPSLNERKDDIPLLVDTFLDDICEDYGVARKMISDEAMNLLQEYNWTGNIRELRNVVERLVILSGKSITKEDVNAYVVPK